jgi:hypothetical protein
VSAPPPAKKTAGLIEKETEISNTKYQMVRQAHHLTTLSQVEGQITMTEIQNPKQLAFDLN